MEIPKNNDGYSLTLLAQLNMDDFNGSDLLPKIAKRSTLSTHLHRRIMLQIALPKSSIATTGCLQWSAVWIAATPPLESV